MASDSLRNDLDPSPLVQVRDLDFSYGSVQVLFGVSLDVYRGETLALVGTNGAGKSTLLRVIAGLSRPRAGTVVVDGADVTGLAVVAMVERGVVLMPGGKAVFADLTVMENLEVGAYTLRRDVPRRDDRFSAVFELFPRLAERRRARAGSLSGGEQQQLALAKALLLEPLVLCIDELSLGLSPMLVAQLLELVRLVNERGTTIVLVEQSLNFAATVAGRAVFMEKGEVRFDGPIGQLVERSDIARAVFFGTASSNGDRNTAPRRRSAVL
jgi:ABC-type branched-subunit amino acid transport system ATPase component